jgi:antitoxin PrlF
MGLFSRTRRRYCPMAAHASKEAVILRQHQAFSCNLSKLTIKQGIKNRGFNMSTATLTSKGQITIPAVVRTALGIEARDQVESVQVQPGHFELVAATQSVTALKGLVRKPAKP